MELGRGQRLDGFGAAWWRQLNCSEQTVSENLNFRITSRADLAGSEEMLLEGGGLVIEEQEFQRNCHLLLRGKQNL